MSRGPLEGSFLQDMIGKANIDTFTEQAKLDTPPRSADALTGLEDQEEDDLSRFFFTAMKKYEEDQRTNQRMNRQLNRHLDRLTFLKPSQNNHDMSDVDMESVESKTYNSIHQKAEYDPNDLWMSEPRRPQVAATG